MRIRYAAVASAGHSRIDRFSGIVDMGGVKRLRAGSAFTVRMNAER